MDNDSSVLKDAAAAVGAIDVKYREADFAGKRELKPKRDEAFAAYAKARRKLLEAGVICSRKDVEEMGEIREEIARARKTQSLVIAAARFVKFLSRL